MGAATAILYAGQHNDVDLLILDSPFLSLYKVASELIEHRVDHFTISLFYYFTISIASQFPYWQHQAHVPKFLVPNVAKISLQLLREKIIKKAGLRQARFRVSVLIDSL